MATSDKTPYEILGVDKEIHFVKLRRIYRNIIHDVKNKKISAEDFRNKTRAYETLSDFDKRKRYDTSQEWISNLKLTKYTAQQLAAESDLILVLEDRLRDAYLTEINAQDPITGHTALYCAARSGNVEAVKFLTETGAESDLSQRTKSTALHVASFYGHPDVVRYLLESGADYRITNSGNSTAQDEAYNDNVKNTFIELKQIPYVRAAANEIDWFSNNVLDAHIDEIYYSQRQTLLHCASKKGHFDLVRLLVQKFSANLDITDINENSALHLSAYGGHIDIVKYLLEKGCNSTLKNRWGLTAEQEGIKYDEKITTIFQSIRNRNSFEMARDGVDWWFQYYFDINLLDEPDSEGVSLLYYACRYGHSNVAKWLLDKGANVNIRMKESPRSTALHGAKYHGQLKIVQLLLEYGADVNIKNDFSLTVFQEGLSEDVDEDIGSEINEILLKHRKNSQENKVIDVHIYSDDENDEKKDNPIQKIQLHHSATYDDLFNELLNKFKNELNYFSIAGRRLIFQKKDATLISAVCRARYANSKFIETPLHLTFHKKSSTVDGKLPTIRQDPSFNHREFSRRFQGDSKLTDHQLKPLKDKQTVTVDKLKFTFSESSVEDFAKFTVRTLFSPNPERYELPGCLCIFEATLLSDTHKLLEMPTVSFHEEPFSCLYTLASPSPYWFKINTRRTRLPILDNVYIFVKPAIFIPVTLTLPIDMIIAAALDQPLKRKDKPVPCSYIDLKTPDLADYPETAYHGTHIGAVQSILTDGLVLPGTVASIGKRINPPSYHIARGRTAYGVHDFAVAIFLSPSIHYSCDSTYAVPFEYKDQQLLPVLECSVKAGSYRRYRSTVSTYIEHPGDDPENIEWRIQDPNSVIIKNVLFISQNESINAIAKARMEKIRK